MLLFGDSEGYISISDRTFHIADRKHRAFRGPIRGLSYLFDAVNHRRQYVVALGDDARSTHDEKSEENSANSAYYVVKVQDIFTLVSTPTSSSCVARFLQPWTWLVPFKHFLSQLVFLLGLFSHHSLCCPMDLKSLSDFQQGQCYSILALFSKKALWEGDVELPQTMALYLFFKSFLTHDMM